MIIEKEWDMKNYFNFYIDHSSLLQLLETKKFQKVYFFVDLSSICRGLFSRNLLLEEFELIKNNQKLTLLLDNLKDFLKEYYDYYQNFNPFFCIFYDLGGSVQNKVISEKYKSNRSKKAFLQTPEEEVLYQKLRTYYFNKIPKYFNIENYSKVICLNEYESDFVPYYYIKKYNLDNKETLKVILSNDKDLLQCCQFKATIQAVCNYLRTEKKFVTQFYGDKNAISYIYKNFNTDQYPNLTSKYIPLLLALSSDRADVISNIFKGFGIASAIREVSKYQLPPDFDSNYPLPSTLAGYMEIIQTNLDLTSFERQIKRIPEYILDKI